MTSKNNKPLNQSARSDNFTLNISGQKSFKGYENI